MTTDSFDPDATLCEVAAGDLFTDPDDFDADPDDLAGEMYSPDGMLRQGDYWTGPAADEDDGDEARDDD
jgi:hypothetical protein